MNQKVEISTYINENEEHFLYVLKEYGKLCKEKSLVHQNYPAECFNGNFRKLLKGVGRNIW